MTRLLARLAALLATAAIPAAWAFNHDTVVPPLAPGPFAVACSNVAVDTARLAQLGGNAIDYWEGHTGYVTDILAAPQSAVTYNVQVPFDIRLYPLFFARSVPFAAIVCHPTPRSNTDPDYLLPTGETVPHMLPAGGAPKLVSSSEYRATMGLADPQPSQAPAKLPYIAFSHGLDGSPISPGYIGAVAGLASYGFVVGAVFHADARFSRVRVEDLNDALYLVAFYPLVAEMMLMRPLSLKAMTDVLLAHPAYSAAIDPDRISGFGASLGGQAMINLVGAKLRTTLGNGCHETQQDPRIKAVATIVPYAGQPILETFCDNQIGAEGVNRPFLGLSGTADITAPIDCMETAMARFKQSRYLVELVGVQHEYKPEFATDLFTWTVTFLDAYLHVEADPGAMARLIRMSGVSGGPEDHLIKDVHVPFPTQGDEQLVSEFHNTILDHYFMSLPGESAAILAGSAGPGWELTGEAFKGWAQAPANVTPAAVPVCRFYGVPAGGPNSHFYTASSDECAFVKSHPGWFYEGVGFFIQPQGSDGRCPDGLLAVNRAYNNGAATNNSNHRFTTSDSTLRDMGSAGWAVEGTAFCTRP